MSPRLELSPAPAVRTKSEFEICILAGGLSSRMGCDKARIRLGPRTLLGHVRHAARQTGLRVRIIRRDVVPRSGPLSGVYTGLARCQAEAVLFLSCDAPLISVSLLLSLIGRAVRARRVVFSKVRRTAGFPFLIWRESLPRIERALADRDLSLQSLARRLDAEYLIIPAADRWQLMNINTPKELKAARSLNKS